MVETPGMTIGNKLKARAGIYAGYGVCLVLTIVGIVISYRSRTNAREFYCKNAEYSCMFDGMFVPILMVASVIFYSLVAYTNYMFRRKMKNLAAVKRWEFPYLVLLGIIWFSIL